MNKAKKSNIEAQANRGKEAGFKGLEELKELSNMAKRGRSSWFIQEKDLLLNRTNKRGFNNY